jgi:hypothetical protein
MSWEHPVPEPSDEFVDVAALCSEIAWNMGDGGILHNFEASMPIRRVTDAISSVDLLSIRLERIQKLEHNKTHHDAALPGAR